MLLWHLQSVVNIYFSLYLFICKLHNKSLSFKTAECWSIGVGWNANNYKGSRRGLLEKLSQRLHARTEDIHEKCQSGQSVSNPVYKSNSSCCVTTKPAFSVVTSRNGYTKNFMKGSQFRNFKTCPYKILLLFANFSEWCNRPGPVVRIPD
jgi:hypothetical protein